MKHLSPLRAGVSRETLARLEAYVALLLKWNRTINLISARDEQHIWSRHIDDALELATLIPADAAFGMDLGSGGGLPGIVLAIATDRPFHLVEADQRKAAFLREAARATGCAAIVHSIRIEACELADMPVITARALAPLTTLLHWSAPKLSRTGICLFPKGKTFASELTAAAPQWQMQVESLPRRVDPSAAILRIRDIQRVQHAT